MSWQPKLNTLDTTRIEPNLIAFIQANQSDALIWANGGTALKGFFLLIDKVVNPLLPNLPALAIKGKDMRSAGGIENLYQINFEAVVFSTSAIELPILSATYARALESMLKEISDIDLFEGLAGGQHSDGEPQITVSWTEVVEASGTLKGFIQFFTMRAVYQIFASDRNN